MQNRQSHQKEAHAHVWQTLVERLGLEDAAERAGRLRDFLNLEADTTFGPVYHTKIDLGEAEVASLYLFEYKTVQFSPREPELIAACMLNLSQPVSSVSLKALRKRHQILEALGASATGSGILSFPDDPDFDRAITVYARDEAGARRLLSKPTRDLLKRSLYDRGAAPTFLLGERQLLFSMPMPLLDAARLMSLELLATDLLSLYAVFAATQE